MQNTQGVSLPQEGFVRLPDFLGHGKPLPFSASTWWRGVKAGKYPAPVKLGENMTAWRVCEIRDLIERIDRGEMADAAQ